MVDLLPSTPETHSPSYVPPGDIISVLSTTLGSLRSLQTSLPLLRDFGVDDDCADSSDAVLPHLETLRRVIDKKLETYQHSSALPKPLPKSILIDPTPIEVKKEHATLNKRDEKAQFKSNAALLRAAEETWQAFKEGK